MTKTVSTILMLLVCLALVAVRMFQEELFYDPLILFFKQEYHQMEFPQLDTARLLWNTSLRYFLNGVLSLALLYLFFKKRSTIFLAALIYLVVFIVLLGIFWYLIHNQLNWYNTLFYVRRFLIQPLLLLVLLPAFYYHKKLQ